MNNHKTLYMNNQKYKLLIIVYSLLNIRGYGINKYIDIKIKQLLHFRKDNNFL